MGLLKGRLGGAADNRTFRFAEGVMTLRRWVEVHADRVEAVTRSWYDLIDRRKFNRMDNDEQRKYEAQLKKKAEKPEYRAWRGDTFQIIPKDLYLWAKKQGK